MTFANPWAAWFLLLIPAVILLYFLKLRRVDTPVSSTLLWARALQDRRANAPFQRLRRSLLLLLQILAILLLVGVLGRPERRTTFELGRLHLVLVDVSASMATVEDGGDSRLDLARRAARDYLRAIPHGERAVLIAFAHRAQALTPVTDVIDQVADALGQLRVQPASGRLDPGMELAISLAGNDTQSDAVAAIFSDGGFPPWQGSEVPLPIDFRAVGNSRPNAGVVALASRLDYTGSGRPQIFVEVRAAPTAPAIGRVSILQQGTVVRAADADLPAGERWSQSFEALAGAGLIEVAWEPLDEDALALDDRGWVVIEERPEVHVWRVGEANFLLDAGLELPFVRLRTLSAGELPEALRETSRTPDLIVWNEVDPGQLPEAVPAHLLMDGLPPGVWEQEPPEQEFPPIISWNRGHPVNRFLTFGRVQVAAGRVLPAAPGVTPLVESRGGALIAYFQGGRQKGIVVGFDILQSTWPTDLSFSLFLHNAIAYLTGAVYDAETVLRGQELLTLQAPAIVGSFTVERPDGERVEVAPETEGWLRYPNTDELGPYIIRWHESAEGGELVERTRTIPVNLLAPRETDIEPEVLTEIGGEPVTGATPEPLVRMRDLWPWLLALALLLLVGEWWAYHRR